MSDTRTARMLTRYNAWANKLFFDAVAKLPEGEATKPRTTLFKNIVHTLNHNYVIDLIFQAHLQGREHGFEARNTQDHPPLDELARAQAALDRWYIDWSDGVTADALNEKVDFKFVGGGPGAMTRGADAAAYRQPHELPPRIRVGPVLSGAGEAADHRPPRFPEGRTPGLRLKG